MCIQPRYSLNADRDALYTTIHGISVFKEAFRENWKQKEEDKLLHCTCYLSAS